MTASSAARSVAGFAGTAFPGEFRRHQSIALDAFERNRAAGDKRHYLTLPPGSGKTLIGLEIVRRMALPSVVLAPNTAIVGQWLDQWSRFEPPLVTAGDTPDLAAPITVLTYQALCVIDRDDATDVADEAAQDGRDGQAQDGMRDQGPIPALTRARRRRLVARGGDREAVLGLLHPNGRAIVDRLASLGPLTLVLDESHHLLELWGSLLASVLESIHPDSVVVALTATPPLDLGPRERVLHDALFGSGADVEVVAPAVVKDGHLAPYQEMALVVSPLADEARFIAREGERFGALVQAVEGPDLGSLPFRAWFDRRVIRRRSPEGAQVAWPTFAAAEPDLARAALRWLHDQGSPPPFGARYLEAHRTPPEAADWAALLDCWATEALAPSADPVDQAAWERLRSDLPAVGYRLTRRGVSRGPSVVDRVLALSASKALGAASILSAESAVLGDRLRALVLCDHAVLGHDPGVRLRGVLDPAAGSAALVLRTLVDGTAAPGLHPVLVTGRHVACTRATAERLVRAARAIAADADASVGPEARAGSASARLLDGARALMDWDHLAAASPAGQPRGGGSSGRTDPDPWTELVLVMPADARWTPRTWVPLLTRCFTDGVSHCLVGTRALLGEGWDAPAVNVVIDLTAATTRAAVHQMRGRGMRIDPADPAKVADLWDVVCVADDHPEGHADHARFARKHAHDLALDAAGEIESGVGHVDPTFTPWSPPAPQERASIRARMLARPATRPAVRVAWRIGQPYRDESVPTVRVRTGRSPGLPVRDVFRHDSGGGAAGERRLRRAAGAALALALLLATVGTWLSGPAAGAAGLALGVLIGTGWLLLLLVGGLRSLGPSDTLLDLARAVADGLAGAGLVDASAGAGAVRLAARPDGWFRCRLEGASVADAGRFAAALDELMSPLWDPRWLIARPVLEVQPTLTGAARFTIGRVTGRTPGMPPVWHAVPEVLSRRQDHVAAFEASWRRWVAPRATAIRARDPQGEAVLAARRGDDPFRTEAQLRTLWT